MFSQLFWIIYTRAIKHRINLTTIHILFVSPGFHPLLTLVAHATKVARDIKTRQWNKFHLLKHSETHLAMCHTIEINFTSFKCPLMKKYHFKQANYVTHPTDKEINICAKLINNLSSTMPIPHQCKLRTLLKTNLSEELLIIYGVNLLCLDF